MVNFRGQLVLAWLLLLLQTGRGVYAQRPSSLSICDYYAGNRYGVNNATTQFRLMQSIVALAFGGGRGVAGADPDSTGILNPGRFEEQDVNLRSWFDGTKATTNLNNQPIGINWLDGGAEAPLLAFLNGSASVVAINNATNQYRLFAQFNTAFGFVFGCTQARQFPKVDEGGGPIALAYVHKFMNLNQTHLGHFIDQLTTASKFFGFSDTDVVTLNTAMNARYNIRCSPAVNGQLNSLCQAQECPLAAPSADCEAYRNLGPNGPGNSTSPTQSANPSSSTTPTSSSSSTTSTPTGSSSITSTPLPTVAGSKTSLSSGAIAGIAIGGAAVLLVAVGLYLYWRRHSRKKDPPQVIPVAYEGSYNHPPSHMSYAGSNAHTSYMGQSPVTQHDSYMGALGASPYHGSPKPPDELGAGVYDDSNRASSPGRIIQHEIAEMDSEQGNPGRGSSPGIQSPVMQSMEMPISPPTLSPATEMHEAAAGGGSEFSSPVYQGNQHGWSSGRRT
ncbi:hypothetical protein GE09DRAFT_1113622 [Coniochaeta sp. 2T2.1]|nr:hypothetical protein GE09DRAFT_1113622 [Coniochaeta sp. 2T2.1]